MKRVLSILIALFCAGVGAVRLLDLAGNTDAATGYLLSGSLTTRYLLLALPVVLIFAVVWLCVPGKSSARVSGAAAIPAFCGLLFSSIIGISLFALHYISALELAAALLLGLGSLWFAAYVLHHGEASLFTGLCATAAWLLICVVLFCTKTASLYHLMPIIELLGSLCALLAVAGFLQAAYTREEKGSSRAVAFRGLLAFYFSFCLMLPQEIWQWKNGISAGFLQGKSIAAGLLGLSGLFAAFCVLWHTEEPEPDDPTSQFEEASRRLQEETGVESPEDSSVPMRPFSASEAAAPQTVLDGSSSSEEVLPPDPQRIPQPQRWQSAACALFGGTAQQPDTVASPTPPVQKAEASQPAFKNYAETNLQAQAVPVSESTSPKPSEASFPAAHGSAEASQAGSAGTLQRLDSLIDHINSKPAKADTVEDILAGLNQTLGGKDTQPGQETAENEKWTFRRS